MRDRDHWTPASLQPNVRRGGRLSVVAAAGLGAGIAIAAHAGTAPPLYYTIQPIGLNDPAHTYLNGLTKNVPQYVNAAGQVEGYALTYAQQAGTMQQQSADGWTFDPASGASRQVGLLDAAHTGYSVNGINASGQAIGAAQWHTSSLSGFDSWLYQPSTHATTLIGPTDAAHSYPGAGARENLPTALNAAGQVIGVSTTSTGNDAWLYNPANSSVKLLGLRDADHTAANGGAVHTAVGINAGSQVAGWSSRYVNNSGGSDAWIYNPTAGTTTIIGLTDPAHLTGGSNPANQPIFLNDAGQVVGTAPRVRVGSYLPGSYLGQDAWLYDPVKQTSIVIGPSDANHTNSFGGPENVPVALNGAGQILGNAPAHSAQQDAWLYDATTNTLRIIGLNDPLHAPSVGSAYNNAMFLNSAGQAVGIAWRYAPWGNNGQDAWFYDPRQQKSIVMEITASPTASVSAKPAYLGDDGTVLGTYQTSSPANLAGVFSWSVAWGFRDVGLAVQGGLAAQGWEGLNGVIGQDAAGDIVGYGSLAGVGGETAFRLTPGPAALAGDVNLDGKVDFADLLAVAQDYGRTGATWSLGDFNGDGIVDFADLIALARNYGRTGAAGAAMAAANVELGRSVPVPEPLGGAAVAMLVPLALLPHRRWQIAAH